MRHFYPAEPNCLLARSCFNTRSNSWPEGALKMPEMCVHYTTMHGWTNNTRVTACGSSLALPATRGRSTTQGCFMKYTHTNTHTAKYVHTEWYLMDNKRFTQLFFFCARSSLSQSISQGFTHCTALCHRSSLFNCLLSFHVHAIILKPSIFSSPLKFFYLLCLPCCNTNSHFSRRFISSIRAPPNTSLSNTGSPQWQTGEELFLLTDEEVFYLMRKVFIKKLKDWPCLTAWFYTCGMRRSSWVILFLCDGCVDSHSGRLGSPLSWSLISICCQKTGPARTSAHAWAFTHTHEHTFKITLLF